MTKKDYRAIGTAVREAFDYGRLYGTWESQEKTLTARLADMFARDNPRFDRERFLRFVATGKDTRGDVTTLPGYVKE